MNSGQRPKPKPGGAGRSYRAVHLLMPIVVLLGCIAPVAVDVSGPALRPAAETALPKHADFRGQSASADARHVADWVVDSGDNRQMAFALVDKANAVLHVFDRAGRLVDATPVLLGSAPGDDSALGIGTRPLAQVRPDERTTPAGRFISEAGSNTNGEDVVWIDYDAAVSMHRVRVVEAGQRRLERLATPTADDNRISYGCINVPAAFYDRIVRVNFSDAPGVVYVLPETRSARAVFGTYDVGERHRLTSVPPAPSR